MSVAEMIIGFQIDANQYNWFPSLLAYTLISQFISKH